MRWKGIGMRKEKHNKEYENKADKRSKSPVDIRK
jgi:hypothetical protein